VTGKLASPKSSPLTSTMGVKQTYDLMSAYVASIAC
jgi:hypothetical protein